MEKIFKVVTGSRLYGTNNENSDKDYMGVMVPSMQEILSIYDHPSEMTENVEAKDEGNRNTSDAIDCKFFDLRKWMHHAAKGQPWALEFLFAPNTHILLSSPEWDAVVENKDLFLSTSGISGFVGFAKSQVNKATVKGENLKKIRQLISYLSYVKQPNNVKLSQVCVTSAESKNVIVSIPLYMADAIPKGFLIFKEVLSENGTPCLEVAGRLFNYGSTVKEVHKRLIILESRYGNRADTVAREDYDWKSLYHAFRNVFEAEEFLKHGHITLPRPDHEIEFLMRVRNKDVSAISGFEQFFNDRMYKIEHVLKKNSPLPSKPNWRKINKLYYDIMSNHLNK